jgi:hypothetical protein
MASHLLYCTLIWSISLVLYRLLLRRQTFHGANRLYLLGTLIAGLLLPLIPAPEAVRFYTAPLPLSGSVEGAVQGAGRELQSTGGAPLPWLPALYLAGALLLLARLFLEVARLIRLFRSGTRHREGRWTVIGTGRPHGPFSVLRCLFVSDRSAYTDAEWGILLRHEAQHARLGHFADALLLELLVVALWFHPLVWYYRRQLLLVHEFQADAGVQVPVQAYGRFLLEQSLLQGAPALAHSFHRSPIKKRLLMLYNRNTPPKYFRLMIALPLVAGSMLYCMKTVRAQQSAWDGNVLTHRGNRIETQVVLPPQNQQYEYGLRWEGRAAGPGIRQNITSVHFLPDTLLVKLNGRPVYGSREVKMPPRLAGSNEFAGDYIIGRLKPLLDRLPEGRSWLVSIRDVLVDERGKVVFFRYGGVHNTYRDGEPQPQSPTAEQRKALEDGIFSLLYDQLTFPVAYKDGKPVPYRLEELGSTSFQVSRGRSRVLPGC